MSIYADAASKSALGLPLDGSSLDITQFLFWFWNDWNRRICL